MTKIRFVGKDSVSLSPYSRDFFRSKKLAIFVFLKIALSSSKCTPKDLIFCKNSNMAMVNISTVYTILFLRTFYQEEFLVGYLLFLFWFWNCGQSYHTVVFCPTAKKRVSLKVYKTVYMTYIMFVRKVSVSF